METITKKCNNCKKARPVEVFGDNGKGECFKTCDTCRASGRERKARAKFEKDVEQEVAQAKVEKDVYKLDDATVMNEENKHLFAAQICCIYVPEKWPTLKVKCNFKEPDGSEFKDFEGFYLDFDKCNIQYKDGASWGEIKENLTYIYETYIKKG
jgi:hypothetical protein